MRAESSGAKRLFLCTAFLQYAKAAGDGMPVGLWGSRGEKESERDIELYEADLLGGACRCGGLWDRSGMFSDESKAGDDAPAAVALRAKRN